MIDFTSAEGRTVEVATFEPSGSDPSHLRRPCYAVLQMTNYNYGGGNPMRPHRVRLTTNLVDGYGLTSKMQLMRPVAKPREDIMLFHADGEYPIDRHASSLTPLVLHVQTTSTSL